MALSLTRELAPVLTALMVTGRVGQRHGRRDRHDARDRADRRPRRRWRPSPSSTSSCRGSSPRSSCCRCSSSWATSSGCTAAISSRCSCSARTRSTYFDNSFQFLDLDDFTSGLIKAAVFGLILSLVACARGYHTEGGAEGVGRSTTQAVVVGSLAILLADFFLTKLLF